MTAPLTFAFSDDVPSAQLERAAGFAGEVRHIQSTSRKKFSGGNHLPPESQHAIADAVNAAVTRKGGKVRVVRCLLERFEELCRRRKCDIDPELRVALARVLAGELAVNRAALGESALKLIGVTVLQGAIGPDLVREFERFRDMPWVFTTAALSHPADPRAFLRKVADTADALAAEPEFEHFRDVTPSIIVKVAVDYPTNARAFLHKVVRTVDMLAMEPEFERFREMPWVIEKAAHSYPSDPRAFLRKVASGIIKLA